MKLKITTEFHDKITDAKYCIGEVVDFSDSRAKEVLKLGFAETLPGEQSPEVTDAPAKKTTRKVK